jgi:hypothetical protein
MNVGIYCSGASMTVALIPRGRDVHARQELRASTLASTLIERRYMRENGVALCKRHESHRRLQAAAAGHGFP